MSYLLSGSTIRAPQEFEEMNSTQFAEHRTLDGTVRRDFFGSNKRVWVLRYRNTKKADYGVIKTIYDSYLTTAAGKSWQVTEPNYTVAATTVHVDLLERGFTIRGTDYISDFDVILKEV